MIFRGFGSNCAEPTPRQRYTREAENRHHPRRTSVSQPASRAFFGHRTATPLAGRVPRRRHRFVRVT